MSSSSCSSSDNREDKSSAEQISVPGVAAATDSSPSGEEDEDQRMILELFADEDEQELAMAREAERDVHGSYKQVMSNNNSTNQNSHERMTKALEGFHEALASIARDHQDALQQAQRLSPQIVALETPPERYILAADFNHWQAAERYALYWQRRRNIFGKDHYHLPLDLSGRGCLSPAMVDFVRPGFLITLPPDQFHRPILMGYLAKDRTIRTNNLPERNQIFFYFFHILCESHLANAHGFVGISVVQTSTIPANFVPDSTVNQLLRSGIFPWRKPCCNHLLMERNPSLLTKFIVHVLTTIQKTAPSGGKFRFRIHPCDATTGIADFAPYGISHQHLPKAFGGSVTSATHDAWFQQRRQLEAERYAFYWNNRAEDASSPKATLSPSPTTDTTTDSALPDPTRHQHHTTNSTKAHFRRVQQLVQLQTERRTVRQLQRDQQQLHAQHAKLSAQVTCAQYIVHLQYERESAGIRAFLQSVINHPALLQTLPGGDDPRMFPETSTTANITIDPAILDSFDYLGRHFVSQQYLFQWKEPAWHSLDPFNQRILQFLLARIPPTLHHETTLEILVDHDDDDEEEAWTQQITRLTNQQNHLKRTRSFLEASNFLANDCARRFEDYKDRNRESLADLISSVMMVYTGIVLEDTFPEDHMMHPTSMANQFLSMAVHGSQPEEHFELYHSYGPECIEMFLRNMGYLSPLEEASSSVPLPSSPSEANDLTAKSHNANADSTIQSPAAAAAPVPEPTTMLPSEKPSDLEERRLRVYKRRKKNNLQRL